MKNGTDLTTKLLLALVATGLWALVLCIALPVNRASAQNDRVFKAVNTNQAEIHIPVQLVTSNDGVVAWELTKKENGDDVVYCFALNKNGSSDSTAWTFHELHRK